MSEDITVTHECIKSVENFGSTTFINICKGGSTVVPWGQSNYFVLVFVVVFIIGVVWFVNSQRD